MQQRAVRVTPPRAERLLGFWQIPMRLRVFC